MQPHQIAAQFFGMFMESRDGVPREVPGDGYADYILTRAYSNDIASAQARVAYLNARYWVQS